MPSRPVTEYQFLMDADAGEKGADLGRRLRAEVVPALLAQEPLRLDLHVTAEPPPRLSVIPFRRRPQALFSMALVPGADPAPVVASLSRLGRLRGGYRVESATPVSGAFPAGTGGPTPGVGLLTLLRQNPMLDRQAFLHEWHGRHTPMSLEIHPLWHYERNVVREAVVPGSPPFDGIVTEHFRERAHLLCPMRLFGGPLRALPNMVRVGLHIRRFLDLRTLETYLVEEYRLH